MKIMQGDEYDVNIALTDSDGEPITDTGVTDVEVGLGGITKTYADGDVTFDSETNQWVFHLSQAETSGFKGILSFQVRVKFGGGDVVGAKLPPVGVSPSASVEVL